MSIAERTVDVERLAARKHGRNSGRTFDMLFQAVKEHGLGTIVVLSRHDESQRVVNDFKLICEHLGRRCACIGVGTYDVNGFPFRFFIATQRTGCGDRARFWIDHAVYDRLPWNDCHDMHQSIMFADDKFTPPDGPVR